MIKMLFTFFRKNGGSKIRDKNIVANFIIFFNRFFKKTYLYIEKKIKFTKNIFVPNFATFVFF